jgi:Tol biopolymer transport system component
MIAFGLYGLYSFWHRNSGPTAFQNMSLEKFTSSGHARVATVSPDGKYVVHVVSEEQGKQSLWIRHVVTGSNTEILPPIEAEYFGLTFSPDGDFVFFVRREPQHPGLGFLYEIPVLGGTPRQVVEDVDSSISFAPDGQHFVFLRNSSTEANSKLIIANTDGTGERVLAKLPLPGYNDPAWSPDGKQIVAVVTDPGGASLGRLVALSADSGKEKTIYATTGLLNKPAWLPDSKTVAFVFRDASTNWQGQIGEVSGGKFRRITNDLNSYSGLTLAVTKDGREMVSVQLVYESGVYLLDSDGKGQVAEISSRRESGVGWLPDGRLVASDDDGHILTMNADGSNRNVVFQAKFPINGISVCPDGVHTLLTLGNPQTKSLNIFSLNLQDGRATALTNGKADQFPFCAPDSKWFIYQALENGKTVLMRMAIAGGTPKQLSDKVVALASISLDGKQLAILSVAGTGAATKGMVEIIPSDGGPAQKTLPLPFGLTGFFNFSPDGQAIYYPVAQKGVGNLVRQNFSDGGPTPLTSFNDLALYGYAFDWQRKKLAVTRGRALTDVVLLKQQAAQ